jgi:hypothetical protein
MIKQDAAKRPRDPRLDFFRGAGLVIIFISHVWNNPWAEFIPARFGFSDATEIFVFCSGMASALAFGSVFVKRGLLLGTARIALRCWQVYWAHIGTFLAALAMTIVLDAWLRTGGAYVDGLELAPLFDGHAKAAILGLLTLTFVPHFFDILPMYLVILAMIPVVMMLAARRRAYAFAFVAFIWLAATFGLAELPAEPWGGRPWFFDPFSWQLVFFTGFALMSGWLPAPALDRRLLWCAAIYLVATFPLAFAPLWEHFAILGAARDALDPLIDKTHIGILRYAHFLALAYLAYAAVGEGGRRLRGPVVDILRRLGQQSLAVFMSGLVLSFLASALLNTIGRDVVTVALVNSAGIAILIGLARAVGWFKSQPWQAKAAPVAGSAPAGDSRPGPAAKPDIAPAVLQPAE